MDPAGRCHFCGGQATLMVSSMLYACETCALRIADLASDPDADLWANHAPAANRATPTAAAELIDTERVFEDFKKGVAEQIAEDDADSHLNLAQAYAEMGLYQDARREAARAADARARASTTAAALRLLLTTPLLPEDGIRRLRERMRRTLH